MHMISSLGIQSTHIAVPIAIMFHVHPADKRLRIKVFIIRCISCLFHAPSQLPVKVYWFYVLM